MFTFVAASVTASGGLLADEYRNTSQYAFVATSQYAFVATVQVAPGAAPKDTFQMWGDSCIRGPLAFYDLDHNTTFALEAGVDYPAGCSSAKNEGRK